MKCGRKTKYRERRNPNEQQRRNIGEHPQAYADTLRKAGYSGYETFDVSGQNRAILRYQPGGRCTAVVLGEGEDVNAVIRRTYPDAMRIASVLPDISCATFNPDNLDDPKELDGTDVAVVKGEIGVAENGAIWIPQAVKYKAIYFISEKLVILLDRNKIVDTMYDAYRELDGQEYQFGTFISGPSKTADIEQALVMGAHGARDVLVILT